VLKYVRIQSVYRDSAKINPHIHCKGRFPSKFRKGKMDQFTTYLLSYASRQHYCTTLWGRITRWKIHYVLYEQTEYESSLGCYFARVLYEKTAVWNWLLMTFFLSESSSAKDFGNWSAVGLDGRLGRNGLLKVVPDLVYDVKWNWIQHQRSFIHWSMHICIQRPSRAHWCFHYVMTHCMKQLWIAITPASLHAASILCEAY
jgi:hypothetical protein